MHNFIYGVLFMNIKVQEVGTEVKEVKLPCVMKVMGVSCFSWWSPKRVHGPLNLGGGKRGDTGEKEVRAEKRGSKKECQ